MSSNRKTRRWFLFIILTFIISIIMAAAAGAFGFILSFLVFGDGSDLYFQLKESLHVEPFFLVPAVLSVIGFLLIWAAAYIMLRTRAIKL